MTLAQEQIQALKAQQYTPKLSAAICVEEEAKCLKCYQDAAASGEGAAAYLRCREAVDAYSACAKASTLTLIR